MSDNPKNWQGVFWHGYAASTAGLSDVQIDFFEAAVKRRPPSGPMVRYFRSGYLAWRPRLTTANNAGAAFFLDLDGLTETPPDADWPRVYVSGSASPVPTTGGATFLPGLLLGRNFGPMDQSAVESRDGVLIFTADPLTADMEVTSPVTATIHVHSSAPTADWTARLCEVRNDGSSYGLVDDITRWTVPGGREHKPTRVDIRPGNIGHLFRARSRIRLQIASSNFPRFNRNPQSGDAANRATAADFVSAWQSLVGGRNLLNGLDLPTIPESYPTLVGLGQWTNERAGVLSLDSTTT